MSTVRYLLGDAESETLLRTAVLIDASNHRFTDKIPELQKTYNSALAWISSTAELTTIH